MQVGATESTAQLIQMIEDSEVPLSEEEPAFQAVKQKHAKGESLTIEEQNLVYKLAMKAREWNTAVESSAMTEREETLPGC